LRTSNELIVERGETVRQALGKLNKTGAGVVLLVDDDGRLLRTVTDGDLRRLLLAGWTLDSELGVLPDKSPRTVPLGTDEDDALEIMTTEQVDQLPVVDEEGCPVGVLLRRELDRRILLSTPHLSEYERIYVEEAFRSNWIAPLGPNVDAFEREFAHYVSSRDAAALSSGTAAIHLGLRLVGVGPGDIVLCSSFTFVASVGPVLYQDAVPVLIDSEPVTWNMSASALRRALLEYRRKGRTPKAVVVVHVYGQSADLDPILQLCQEFGVAVIEDAAESLGATYKGRMTGTFGSLGAYSFNGNKIITTSGGGMLVSDDMSLIERARKLSTQAREPVHHYEHVELGYNYRMSNVLAGIGLGQLCVIEDRVAARRRICQRYREGLRQCEELEWPEELPGCRSTHWLSTCLLNPSKARLRPEELIEQMAEEGIEARRLWKPMHRQPLFIGSDYYPHALDRSVSDYLFERGLCLPSGSNLTDAQQERIIGVIERAIRRSRVH
jgi:dTDP-4-amino-4,6-dideoxygalactose transaminase